MTPDFGFWMLQFKLVGFNPRRLWPKQRAVPKRRLRNPYTAPCLIIRTDWGDPFFGPCLRTLVQRPSPNPPSWSTTRRPWRRPASFANPHLLFLYSTETRGWFRQHPPRHNGTPKQRRSFRKLSGAVTSRGCDGFYLLFVKSDQGKSSNRANPHVHIEMD